MRGFQSVLSVVFIWVHDGLTKLKRCKRGQGQRERVAGKKLGLLYPVEH